MVAEILSTAGVVKNIARAVRDKRDTFLEKRFSGFIAELEVENPVLVSLVIKNLLREFREGEFEQILYASIERSRSDFEAKLIAKLLVYCGREGNPTLFLPLVAAVEQLLPGDLAPLAEGFAIHEKMKSNGLFDGIVHPETRQLRELFKRPGIRQRYYAAGLSVIRSNVGPGDIVFSNELPPHLIKALGLE